MFVDVRSATQWSVGQLLERYRNEVTIKKRSAAVETIRINAMLRDKLAQYSLSNLTLKAVAEWRDRRLEAVTGSTVNRDLNTMHHMIEIARKKWGIGTPINVVGEITRAKETPGRVRRLSAHEEKAIFAACA